MRTYESMVDALMDMSTRGYKNDFNTEAFLLHCNALSLRLYPEEFTVDEVYRFEEDSNPEDNAVLYAISSNSGVKGVLIDGYGVYAEKLSFETVKKLKNQRLSYNSKLVK